jgi:predicted Zn finger-like uncharacterized protein
MPIDAQCGSCTARYRVVDSAAGRRVKCRRCGNAIDLPGEAAPVDPFAVLSELEKSARPVAVSPDAALIQYRAVMSTVNPDLGAPATHAKHATPISKLRRPGSAAASSEEGPRRRSSGVFGRVAGSTIFFVVLSLVRSYFSPFVAGLSILIFLIAGLALCAGACVWGIVMLCLKGAKWEPIKAPVIMLASGLGFLILSFVVEPLVISMSPWAAEIREAVKEQQQQMQQQHRHDSSMGPTSLARLSSPF